MDTPPNNDPAPASDPFPVPAGAAPARTPPPPPDSRIVDAGRGVNWILDGWTLFKEAPGSWVACFVIFVLIMIVLGIVPLLGNVAGAILSPFLIAGLMLGCAAIERNEEMMVSHLFAGFGPKNGPLFVLGLIEFGMSLIVLLVAMVIVFLVAGAAFVGILLGNSPAPGATLAAGFWLSILLMIAILLALFIPVIMASWFAPALVVLDGAEPVPALISSFRACLKNTVPFLVYGVVMLGLAIVATIPLGLGWLLLGPVGMASIYTAYKDIYASENGVRS